MMNRVWFHPYQTLSEIRNHLFLSGARRALGQRSPSSGSPQLRLHGPDSCPGVNKPRAGCAYRRPTASEAPLLTGGVSRTLNVCFANRRTSAQGRIGRLARLREAAALIDRR